MKIKEFEEGSHCFGPILTVNGKDYDELDPEEIIGFINDRMRSDINSYTLTREIFSMCLEYLQGDFDEEASYQHKCDQCGNDNYLNKYIIDEEG